MEAILESYHFDGCLNKNVSNVMKIINKYLIHLK
jgi:hypothetical protein